KQLIDNYQNNNMDNLQNLWENAVNQFDYIINNNDMMNNDNKAGIHFVPNPYTYSPIYQSSKIVSHNSPSISSSSIYKDKQFSVKLDDLSPFNFKGLPEETISNDSQVQQVFYHFNCLVKAMEKGQFQSSKETFLVHIL
ncbi:15050_t:CDS:2, partial [Racocetra persica]